MALHVRPVSEEERATIKRLAHARTEPARRVERAQIIWRALHDEPVPAIARALGCNPETVRLWLRRFTTEGLDGLRDRSRSGRPPTYTAEQIGAVLATALTKPADLGQPFGSWTLDRLQAYLNEVAEVPIKRSRIDEILIGEGLRWRSQETWFGERVDPAFAEKRGRSSRSIRSHLRTAS